MNYWVFSDEQLEDALGRWRYDDPDQDQAAAERASLREFLYGDITREMHMRRGEDNR